jgi:hypothetical protein
MNNMSMPYNAHDSACSTAINLYALHSSHSFSVSLHTQSEEFIVPVCTLYLQNLLCLMKSFTAHLSLHMSCKLLSGECLLLYKL